MNLTRNVSKKILVSCFLAGCLEIYDFTIFGFLAPTINRYYLTFLNEKDALIMTYALFAVGFLFRPLGALLFGYIGDRYGRKFALILSVSIMGSASFLMFLLPTYSAIGIWSCYIIALIRILQGISVGGEYSGAIIFAVEHSDKKYAGIVGSIVVSGCMSGVLLATIVSQFLQYPSLPDYSWRFAFLLGFILSFIGYFIRKRISETPEFLVLLKNKEKLPIFYGFKSFFLENIATLLIAATNGINLYFMTVFLPRYLGNILGYNVSYLAVITTSIMALCIPIFGYISDRVGRKKQLLFGLMLLILITAIALPVILYTQNIYISIFLIICHAIIASIQSGAMNTYIIEIFPVKCRYSCSGFSYSIGMGVIGGSSPMISALITENFHYSIEILTVYVSAVSIFALFAVYKISNNKMPMNKSS